MHMGMPAFLGGSIMHKKWCNPFLDLTGFEWGLWLFSLLGVTASFLLSPAWDILSLCASLVGVTALLFVSKGYVLGQVLTVVFAVFYGFISFFFSYYGEVLTYLGMTAPIALLAVFSWLKNPYAGTKTVAVRRLGLRTWLWLFALSFAVTLAFYFILGALGTANLPLSTLSVFTSFLASSLTFLRSPYYALAYAGNDLVLILLWLMAALADPGYIPMIACFFCFLLNDLYGLVNWRRMQARQQGAAGRPKSGSSK